MLPRSRRAASGPLDQGELINKTGYMRSFLDQRERVDGYDYSRIEAVLDIIITNCVRMREAELIKAMDAL
jgi:hypothetical protein